MIFEVDPNIADYRALELYVRTLEATRYWILQTYDVSEAQLDKIINELRDRL